MFDHIQFDSISANPDPAAPLREFADHHRGGLLNAAGLLGGRWGVRLVLDALDGLASEPVLTRRTQTRLMALLELLSLEHVHDQNREESARFAAINPCDPVVEEICALTVGLRDALERATTDHRPASHRVAA
ncbi:hypothetical protein LCGC14_1587300 [marine sediment metagenome]|uniref:Uncharacterized protein n=1 Tax=marine sediment metagenome TaxID=412755 RepID=A0A0F9KVP4_9ZZZZ